MIRMREVATTDTDALRRCGMLSRGAAEAAGRSLAFALARVYAGALLASHAQHTQARDDVAAASRWTASLASTHGLNLVVPTAASLEDGP